MRFNLLFSTDVPVHLKKGQSGTLTVELRSSPNTNLRATRTLRIDEDMTLDPEKNYRAVPLHGRTFKIEEIPGGIDS